MDPNIVLKRIDQLVRNNSVLIFSDSKCPNCRTMKDVLDQINVAYTSVELDQIENGQVLKNVLSSQIKSHAIPQIFIGGDLIGDFDDFMRMNEDGLLHEMLASLNIIKS